MKKFLSLLCVLSIVALLSACDNGDDKGGSNGTTIPEVSWDLTVRAPPVDDDDPGRIPESQVNWVQCYNANKSVITNPFQTCEWYCGTLDGSPPRYYKVTFLRDDAGVFTIENISNGVCRL
jgi:hypothetical protein